MGGGARAGFGARPRGLLLLFPPFKFFVCFSFVFSPLGEFLRSLLPSGAERWPLKRNQEMSRDDSLTTKDHRPTPRSTTDARSRPPQGRKGTTLPSSPNRVKWEGIRFQNQGPTRSPVATSQLRITTEPREHVPSFLKGKGSGSDVNR